MHLFPAQESFKEPTEETKRPRSIWAWKRATLLLIFLFFSGIVQSTAVPTANIGGTPLLQRAARNVVMPTDVAIVAEGASHLDSPPPSGSSLQQLQGELKSYSMLSPTKDVGSQAVTATGTGAGAGGIAAGTHEQLLLQPHPKGQCLLNGAFVAKDQVVCEQRVGCRAIQKTGHCCPDYKCDCEKEGKSYLNGEKLVDPENPCTVCYCQGGDILCSPVTCFYRDDCTPKYIPGRCCPEYDNCPVSMDTNTESNHQLNTTLIPPTAIPSPQPEHSALNPKITIKEITKAVEIRITDDNKAVPHVLKPIGTTEASTMSTANTGATSSTPSPTIASTSVSPTNTVVNPNPPLIIGLHITEIKNIPKSSNSSTFSLTETKTNIVYNVPPPARGINDESSNLRSTTESSSALIVKAMDLQGGGNLVDVISQMTTSNPKIVKKHTKLNSQELQRINNAELAQMKDKINTKREFFITTEEPNKSNITDKVKDSADHIDKSADDIKSTAESKVGTEPYGAGSSNVYHIVESTTEEPKLSSTTEKYLKDMDYVARLTEENRLEMQQSGIMANESESSDLILKPSPAVSVQTKNKEASSEAPIDNDSSSSTTEVINSSTSPRTTSQMEEEDAVVPVELNPAYPSLPEDDFSLRDVNFPLSETDDAAEGGIQDESRSVIGVAAFETSAAKNTKHLSDTGAQSTSVTAVEEDPATTASTKNYTLNGNVEMPVHIDLLNAGIANISDDGSGAYFNNSDFQFLQVSEIEAEYGSGYTNETSLDGFQLIGNGTSSTEASPSNKFIKEREQTTARSTAHTTAADIDELSGDGFGSGDGKNAPIEDPKLDAESLKLDEGEENGGPVEKSNSAGKKDDILSVATALQRDKTLEEHTYKLIKRILSKEMLNFRNI